jgi:hypothetical protein
MFPSSGDPVGQHGNILCQLQAANFVELNLSPSSILCIFCQYRINGYVSRDDADLREDQQSLFDEVVFVEERVIAPKFFLSLFINCLSSAIRLLRRCKFWRSAEHATGLQCRRTSYSTVFGGPYDRFCGLFRRPRSVWTEPMGPRCGTGHISRRRSLSAGCAG